MASSGKVVIDPEHVKDGDGTLRTALQLWCCRNGPVQFNQWQSAFFALARMPGLTDEETSAGESLSTKQKRIRDMYDEIQGAIYGSDHKAAALLKVRASTEPAIGSEVAPFQGLQEQSLPAAGQVPGRVAAQGLPSRVAEEYVMATPSSEQAQTPEIADGSPDRFLHLPGAEDAWEEEAATHTEITADEDERMERLAGRLLLVEGADQLGVEFVVRVEQLLPEYKALYGEWVALDPEKMAGLRSRCLLWRS